MPVAIVSAEEEEVNQGSLPCPSETESAAESVWLIKVPLLSSIMLSPWALPPPTATHIVIYLGLGGVPTYWWYRFRALMFGSHFNGDGNKIAVMGATQLVRQIEAKWGWGVLGKDKGRLSCWQTRSLLGRVIKCEGINHISVSLA